jgi:putative transposase
MSEAKGNEVGFDGRKQVKGRKRSILTDTMGYVITALVHSANIYDGKAGIKLIDKAFNKFKLKKIWADNTYRGEFVTYSKDKYNCDIEINQRKNNKEGFKPVRKRRAVERTLAWLTRNRRLAREYERTIESSEAMIYAASLRLLLKHATYQK